MATARSARRAAMIAGFTLLAVAVASTAPAPAAAGPASPAGVIPRLNWATCYQKISAEFDGTPYECATGERAARPRRSRRRRPAARRRPRPGARPENKIGSIFLNPGGPGGSGVDFALFFGPAAEAFWGSEVRDRFDIVGFDPRGVGRSTALRCFGNLRQSTQVFAPFPFPLTPEDEALVAGRRRAPRRPVQPARQQARRPHVDRQRRPRPRPPPRRRRRRSTQLRRALLRVVSRDHVRQHVPRPRPGGRRRRRARPDRLGERRRYRPVLDPVAFG